MEYEIHRLLREVQLMFNRAAHAGGIIPWISGLLVLFSIAFFLVGIARVVEFEGLGLSRLRKIVLTMGHILGCFVFSFMLVLFAVDVDKTHNSLLAGVFISSLLLLFPVHIYVGLLRRIRGPAILTPTLISSRKK